MLLPVIVSFITCFNIDKAILIPSFKLRSYLWGLLSSPTGLYKSLSISVAPSQPAPILTALYSVYVPDKSVRKLHSKPVQSKQLIAVLLGIAANKKCYAKRSWLRWRSWNEITIFVLSSSPKDSITSDRDWATLSVYDSIAQRTTHTHRFSVIKVMIRSVHSSVVNQSKGICSKSTHRSSNMVINLHNLYHTAQS